MGSTAGGAAILVARAFREAAHAGVPADAVEVFSSGGLLTVIVNCYTDGSQDRVWQGLASWFHHAIAQGSLALERTDGGVSISVQEQDIERAIF